MNNETIIFVSASNLVALLSGSLTDISTGEIYNALWLRDQSLNGTGKYSGSVAIGFQSLNFFAKEFVDPNLHRLGWPRADNGTGIGVDSQYQFGKGNTGAVAILNGQFYIVNRPKNGLPLALESTSDYALLHTAILHHRNGPFGWPSWKQLRTSEHPVARWQQQNNIVAVKDNNFVFINNEKVRNIGPTITEHPSSGKTGATKKLFSQFKEPVLTHRYHPLKHSFVIQEGDDRSESDLIINHSYGNSVSTFSHRELRNRLNLEQTRPKDQIYDSLKSLYLDGTLDPAENPFKRFNSLKYKETIFPRETNTTFDYVRNRIRYNVEFWKDNRVERSTKNRLTFNTSSLRFDREFPTNSQGYTILSQSMWPMDPRTTFPDGNAFELTGGIDGAGELQNTYTQYHAKRTQSGIKAAPLYSKLIPMSSSTYQEASIKIVMVNPTAASLSGSTLEINSGSLASGVLYTFTGINHSPSLAGNQWRWADGNENTSVIRLARLINAQSSSAAHEPLYLRAVRSSSAATDTEAIQLFAMHVGGRGNNFQARINAATGNNTEFYISSSAGAATNNTAVSFEYGSGDPIYFGGQTLWEAGQQAGKNPFTNSYQDHVSDLRTVGKNFSLIPEFKISDHIEKLVETEGGNFLADLPEFLSLSGTMISDSSVDGFYKTYSTTDFLKYFDIISTDHESLGYPSELTLTCKALMKFHPYNGFYPAVRTVQLAQLFSQSYGPVTELGGTEGNFRTLMQPFFAPGILYNSIKSGIAVDYPVYLKDNLSNISTAVKIDRGTRRRFIDEQDLPDGIVTNTTVDGVEANIDVSRGRGIDYVFGYDVGEPTSVVRQFDQRLPFESILNPIEYLKTGILLDEELNPSASLDSYVRMTGLPSQLYSMGMNNFLASSIDFFLEEGKLTSFVSEPETQFQGGTGYLVPESKKNNKYVLDVYLLNGNLPDLGGFIEAHLVGSAGWRQSPTTTSWLVSDHVDNNIVMYNDRKAFGNPIIERNTNGIFASPTDFSSSMPNYATVTPPYYDGLGLARIVFDPNGMAGVYSLEDIHQSMSVSYIRLSDTVPGVVWQSFSDCYDKLFMQVTGSIVLDGVVKGKKTIYGQQDQTNQFQINGIEDDGTAPNSWVISTRYETPVLDYANAAITQPTNGYARKGVWHQYGTDISNEPNKGIFLKISDVNEFEKRNSTPQSPLAISLNGETVESLADLVGFKKESKKIGRVANSKVVKEAIVAIPFKKDANDQMVFYSIPRSMIDYAQGVESALGPKKVKPGNSILNMVNKMKDYVLPPKFNFLMNKVIDPFVMYIFEFAHEFNRQDLIDIWQNLPPNSLRSIKEPKETSMTISHPLLIDEFYGITKQGLTSRLESETQWLVFKVKQKGSWNYFEKTEDSKDDDRFKFKFKFGKQGSRKIDTLDYSYNWPYDYFTMIELAQIDATVTYRPGNGITTGESPDVIVDNPLKQTIDPPTKQTLEKNDLGGLND